MVCMWKSEENFQGVGSLLSCRFWGSHSGCQDQQWASLQDELPCWPWFLCSGPGILRLLLWICQTIASLPNHRLWMWSLAQRKPCGLYSCTCSHLRYAVTHTSLASNNSWHVKSESILPLSFQTFCGKSQWFAALRRHRICSLHSSCSFCLVYQLFVFS